MTSKLRTLHTRNSASRCACGRGCACCYIAGLSYSRVFACSYACARSNSPDPDGWHLSKIGAALERESVHYRMVFHVSGAYRAEMGIFWDCAPPALMQVPSMHACMTIAWRLHGACMAHAWRMHGACMAHLLGLCALCMCMGTGEAQHARTYTTPSSTFIWHHSSCDCSPRIGSGTPSCSTTAPAVIAHGQCSRGLTADLFSTRRPRALPVLQSYPACSLIRSPG